MRLCKTTTVETKGYVVSLCDRLSLAFFLPLNAITSLTVYLSLQSSLNIILFFFYYFVNLFLSLCLPPSPCRPISARLHTSLSLSFLFFSSPIFSSSVCPYISLLFFSCLSRVPLCLSGISLRKYFETSSAKPIYRTESFWHIPFTE